MKLNAAQIEELYVFTRKKYVEHYDVQTELVDHLANSIEEKMSASNINFETALQQVYAQFGIFGFSELVEKKGTEAIKKGRYLFRNSILEYFKLPKILLLALIFIVCYKVFEVASPDFIAYSFYSIICLFNFMFIIKSIKVKRSVKIPLLQFESIHIMSSSFGASIFIFQIFFKSSLPDLNQNYQALLPLFFSVLTIIYLAEIDVLDKLFNQQKKLYPEAFK
ncbi:MAG: hypothetical protein U5M51_09995 [Emticicia sp.]|nr:hypothetical protein [Emticicia sp.]